MAAGVEEETLSPEDQAAVDAANARPDGDGPPDEERTLEEMAEQGEEPKPVPPTQLAIEGTRDKIGGSFGGKIPTESELRIVGSRRPINGSYEKGEQVAVLVTGTVRAVEGIDAQDEWGTVTKTTRVHKLRMLHVRVASREALMRELVSMGLSRQEVGILHDEVTA